VNGRFLCLQIADTVAVDDCVSYPCLLIYVPPMENLLKKKVYSVEKDMFAIKNFYNPV